MKCAQQAACVPWRRWAACCSHAGSAIASILLAWVIHRGDLAPPLRPVPQATGSLDEVTTDDVAGGEVDDVVQNLALRIMEVGGLGCRGWQFSC